MKRITQLIEKNLDGRKVLLLFILTNILYAFMLIVTIPMTMEFADGLKLLDMMPTGYNWEYVHRLFITLGNKGREIYLYKQIPMDMIYPGLFGFTYCLIIAYFLRKIDKLKSPFIYLCLLPIIAGAADYLENFGTIVMLTTYPDPSQFIVSLNNIFTIVKSMTTTIFFVGLIIILIFFGLKTLSRKKSSTDKI
jgi:hypothetical protein